MKVLAVDDKAENRYLLESMLKSLGCEVVGAANGAEALGRLHGEPCDMIISDVLMPVMDGFQLCRKIKEDERFRSIPFVFYTATYTDDQDEALALRLGADRYIRKGIDPEDFMREIQEAVSETEQGTVTVRCPELERSEDVFEVYSYRLVQKLEQKMLELRTEMARRKRAEAALKESEERFRRLCEVAEEGIAIHDGGIILEANEALARMFGYDLDEMIGTCGDRYTTPETWELIMRKIAIGYEKPYEGIGVRKDGSTFVCELVGRPYEFEGRTLRVAAFRDITERKQAEETLLRRNRELMALNSIIQTVTQSLDLDEILMRAVDETLEILHISDGGVYLADPETENFVLRVQRGFSPDSLKPISKLRMRNSLLKSVVDSGEAVFIESLPDARHKIGRAGLEAVLEEGARSGMFIPLVAKGEALGVLIVTTRGGRVFNEAERELLITIGHAVSTAVQNARLLQDAARARTLEELDRLKTVLLASVSHELRTPLTSIKGIASSLVQPDVDWDIETQREFLRAIDQASDRLTHIVSDLVDMSQLEAGIMRMDKEYTTVATIVGQIEGQLQDLARTHRFEASLPEDLPAVFADEVRVGEVITNLVSNAVSYSEEGTLVKLEATQVGSDVRVAVSDQGVGIPTSHLSKVFDRFYRLESGASRRRGGSGLGLAICKGIVEAHGGRIWAQSTPEQGSVFIFTLPVAKRPTEDEGIRLLIEDAEE